MLYLQELVLLHFISLFRVPRWFELDNSNWDFNFQILGDFSSIKVLECYYLALISMIILESAGSIQKGSEFCT